MLTMTSIPHGGEIEGWDYRGYKCNPTVEFNLSDSSLNKTVTYNGTSYTYRALIEEAITTWNNKNIKNDGTLMFRINNGLQLRKIKAIAYTGSTAQTFSSGSIDLNTNEFPSLPNKQKAVDVITHEMGHTLGLADLYIQPGDGYVYNGNIIDNRNKMMYGWWNVQSLSGTGANRIHSIETYGLRMIHGWASYKKLTEEELYQQADMIVKGTVLSARDYTNHPSPDLRNMYSEITLRINEAIRGTSVDETIKFLQNGQSDCPMAVDPLLKPGEECLLYLQYDDSGMLHILGGPQGRYNITQDDNRIVNQIDKFNYDSMENIPDVIRPSWTKVSKDKAEFIKQVKLKQQVTAKQK